MIKTYSTAVDTEYVQRIDSVNQMITTQLVDEDGKEYIFEHPNLHLNILPTWNSNTKCILSTILDLEEKFTGEFTAKKVKNCHYLIWNVLMFFAPSDLLAGLFNDFDICRFIQGFCIQDARIRLEIEPLPLPIFYNDGTTQLLLSVTDYGKVSQGGLAQVVKSFGGNMLDKTLMDDYKTNMIVPYKNPKLRKDFIDYAMDDARQLWFIKQSNNERTEKLFNIHNLPLPKREIITTGSLVAKLLLTYLENHLGDFDASSFFYKKTHKGKIKPYDLKDLLHHCSVDYFAKLSHSRKQVNALIQGGRAKNERPDVIKVTGVIADTDLSSCYVNILNNLYYPIGLPSVYGQHINSKTKMKLGKFLKKFGSQLVDRLFVIVVSGELNHTQTLVPSKVIEDVKINLKYEPDNPKIPADFRLYTREIINGVITSDVLDILNNTCNFRELKSWMDLEVVSATWFPKDLQHQTPRSWYGAVEQHTDLTGNDVKTLVNDRGKEFIQDDRCKDWLAVPISNFLKPYADERKQLKSAMKEQPKGSELYDELNSKQLAMKLVGNTCYGVLASPYFPVGNVVVANNITTAARCAVWLTAIATGSYQSITDGGAYNLNAVRDWQDKKPSMNTLSLWRNPEYINKNYRKYLFTKPLCSTSKWLIETDETNPDVSIVSNAEGVKYDHKEGMWKEYDEELLNHLRHFFRDGSAIDILNIIGFEHKDIYTEAVFHSQTNYRFKHVNGTYKIKARGHKLKGTPYNNDTEQSNIVELFNQLADNPNAIKPFRPQTISQVLKCNEANKLTTAQTDNVVKRNKLLAGDSISKRSWIRPISLSMFHWMNDRQYQTWCKASDRLKQDTGYGMEHFFLNPDGTLDYERAIKTIQDQIDCYASEFLVTPNKLKTMRKDRVIQHPFFV